MTDIYNPMLPREADATSRRSSAVSNALRNPGRWYGLPTPTRNTKSDLESDYSNTSHRKTAIQSRVGGHWRSVLVDRKGGNGDGEW